MLWSFLLLVAPSPGPGEMVRAVDVESLTLERAVRLAHAPRLWRVVLASAADRIGGREVFEVEAGPGLYATAWCPPGWIDQRQDEHHVRAVLRIIRHRPAVVDGVQLPGFTETRLVVR